MEQDNKEKIFFRALLLAFITHCSLFFGGAMWVNEDNWSIYRKYLSSIIQAPYGRWFGDVCLKLGIISPYRTPAWAGIFVIIALAITCIAVLSVLKINNKVPSYLVMAVLVSFPTLAYSYGYMLDSVLYALSLMLATLSVWMVIRWKFGWVGGAICLMLSLALYQAWLAFAVTLVIVHVVIMSKDENINKEDIFVFIFRSILMGIAGAILYLVSTNVFNFIFHVKLYSYKGLNSMGNIQLSELPEKISNCYKAFRYYITGKYYIMSEPIIWLNYVVIAIIVVFTLFYFIQNIRRKKYVNAFLYLVFTLVLPIGMCFLELVMNTDTLSVYANCMMYILLIKYCDDWIKEGNSIPLRWKKIFGVGVYTVGTIMVAFFFFVTQMYYQKGHVFFQRTYALANRITMRIEEMEKDPSIRKVVVAGELFGSQIQSNGSNQTMFADVISNDRGLFGQYVGIGEPVSTYQLMKFVSFMNGLIGTDYQAVKLEEALPIIESDEYLQMPIWPDKESVKVIDDIIFVKMYYYRYMETEETNGKYLFRLKAEEQGDVIYWWRVYKDNKKIIDEENTSETFETVLEEPGTYLIRLHVKDSESNEVLFDVASEEIIIE